MNKLLKIFIAFLYFGAINNISGQIWPTTSTSYKVGLSYGSFEDRKQTNQPEEAFHDGIDIEGLNGIVNVRAIGDGEIVDIQIQNNSVNIFFKLYAAPYDIVVYGHCKAIPGNNLYKNKFFSAGNIIATIASSSDAKTGYDHCHFSYINSTSHLDFPNLTVNPLLQNCISSVVKDPGNTDPIFEDLIIRPDPINGNIYDKNNNSLNCLLRPYIYNKVKLVKEIRDDLGHSVDCFLNPELNNIPWSCFGSTNMAYQVVSYSGVGAPYSIGFEIKDKDGNSLTSAVNYSFSQNFINFQNMCLLYDAITSNSGFGLKQKGDITLKYQLTNIVGLNNVLQNRSWNTKVRSGWDYWDPTEARCIEEARFKDNRYLINTKAKDLSTRTAVEKNDEVVIDNFKPYVKNVIIYAVRSNVQRKIYEAGWQWNAGAVELQLWPSNKSDRVLNQYIPNLDDRIEIEVTYSEPMIASTLAINIYSECLGHHKTTSYSSTNTNQINLTTNDNIVFKFLIPNNQLSPTSHSQMQDIEFIGNDATGNNLMTLSEENTSGIIGSDEIPNRDNTGNWINDDFFTNPITGDIVHHFGIEGCFNNLRIATGGTYDGPMSICDKPDFNVDNQSPNVGTNIQFTNLTSAQLGSTYLWDFGDGSTPPEQRVSPNHIYNLPGIFDVKLTVNGSESIIKNQYINVLADGTTALLAEFEASSEDIHSGQMINFTNKSTGGNGTVTYQWSFGNGAQPSNSNTINPKGILFLNEDDYNVTLTATNGNITSEYMVPIRVSAGTSSGPLSFSIIAISPNNSNVYNFHANNVSGGIGTLQYDWDFGDGQGLNKESPSHTYDLNYSLTHSLPYTVKLTITDASGSSLSETIEVSPSFSSGTFNNLNFTASPLYFPDVEGVCGTLVNFESTIITPDLFFTEFKWDIINRSDNINYGTNDFQLGRWSPQFALSRGIYDVTVHAKFGGQEITSATKTSYINICQPNPNEFSINDFSLKQTCYPVIFNVFAHGGEGFPNGFNIPVQADVQGLKAFGLEAQRFNIIQVNFVPGTNLIYYITTNNTNPSNFPVNITYTLHLFQNKKNHFEIYESITKIINITLNKCATVDVGPSDLYVCKGGHKNLGGSPTVADGVSPITYEWSILSGGGSISNNNSANPIFTAPNSAQDISCKLKIKDGSGKIFPEQNFTIHVYDLVANAGPDIHVCINSNDKQLGIPISNSENLSFHWTPAINLSCNDCPQPFILPSNTGTYNYNLVVTDVTGCVAQDPVQVTISNKMPKASSPPDVYLSCAKNNEDVSLQGNVIPINGSYQYYWSGDLNITNPNGYTCQVHPLQTTTFIFKVTDQNTGCSSSDNVTVFVNSNNSPKVDLGPEVIGICNGNLPVIIPTITNTNSYGTFWFKDDFVLNSMNIFSSDETIQPELSNIDHDYILLVIDWDSGCQGLDKIKVRPDNISYTKNLPQYINLNDGINPTYSVTCNIIGGVGQRTYEWGINGSPGIPLQDFMTLDQSGFGPASPSQFYNCNVVDELGCSVDAKVQAVYHYHFADEYLKNNDLIKADSEDENVCSGTVPYTLWTCFDFIDPVIYNPPISNFNNQLAATQGWLTDPNPQSQLTQFLLYTVTGGQVQYGHETFDQDCIAFLTPDATYTVEAYFGNPFEPITFSKTIQTEGQEFALLQRGVCGNEGSYFSNFVSIPSGSEIKAMTIIGSDIGQPCNILSIDDNHSLFFKAGKEIILRKGFEALEGSTFIGEVTSCWYPGNNRLASAEYQNKNLRDSLKDNTDEKFRVYPNPTYNNINISIHLDDDSKKELVLSNQLGEMIKIFVLDRIKNIDFTYDLNNANIKQGIYYLTLKSNDIIKSKKIVFIN